MKRIFYVLVLLLFTFDGTAQLDLIGQYRFRAEMLDGYKKPLYADEDIGINLAHRARVGLSYTHERFKFNFSVQDVRVWGNVPPLALDNGGLISLHEANIDIFFSKKWSLKLGRQPIKYDNGLLFDEINWTMQGQKHDALIVKYKDSTWSLDIGATYRNHKEVGFLNPPAFNDYRTFQYAWLNKKWNNFQASITILNNGMDRVVWSTGETSDYINFTQTYGTYLKYKVNKWQVDGFGYYQMGINEDNRRKSAFSLGLEGQYQPNKNWTFTLGAEMYSGTAQQSKYDPNHWDLSFWTMYGGGHARNGYMDYFYAANHYQNVGLINGYFKASYKIKKFEFLLANHFFSSATDVILPGIPFVEIAYLNPFIGYELDFRVQYHFIDEITFELGYSHIFGTETLTAVKGGDSRHPNFAYIMLEVYPFKNLKLFKDKMNK